VPPLVGVANPQCQWPSAPIVQLITTATPEQRFGGEAVGVVPDHSQFVPARVSVHDVEQFPVNDMVNEIVVALPAQPALQSNGGAELDDEPEPADCEPLDDDPDELLTQQQGVPSASVTMTPPLPIVTPLAPI
jgi:hypothetical protein